MKITLVVLSLVIATIMGCGPEDRIVEVEVTTAPEVRAVEVTATPTPTPTLPPTPQVRIEPVSFTAEDGVALSGYLFGGEGDTAVLLAHTWTTDQRSWESFAKLVASQGFTVLTFDFRGYGESASGGSVEHDLGCYRDAQAATKFLEDRGFSRIVCMGASIGGAACMNVALQTDLAGLVLISSQMPRRVIRESYPKDLLNPTMPKLIVGTEEDPYDPEVVSAAPRLYEMSPEPKEIRIFPGTAHGTDLFDTEYGGEFRDLLLDFLENSAQITRRPAEQPTHMPESVSYWPTGGWRTSIPEEQGMDSEMLAEMFGTIREQDYDIDSVTVIRNGYMVADATVYPFRSDSLHIINSCTKSIVSALIGIAIDKGYIESVDQPILGLFPERSAANLDEGKEAMTLEHVLMMASGLECRDSYLYRWRGLREMRQSDDWVQFVLDLPMAEPPGTRFEYCNGGSLLLSAIIQETTGMSASEFAQEHLFNPLGISDVEWPSNPQGISIGWGELHMRPHDMVKIGYLYLNEGRWDGEQIVPSAWVAASTRKHISATLQDGYGYQWWITDDGVYMALGYAGQFIFVVPEKELVVAFASELEESDFYVPQELLNDFIIPAAESSTPLPVNPDGVELLGVRIDALANP